MGDALSYPRDVTRHQSRAPGTRGGRASGHRHARSMHPAWKFSNFQLRGCRGKNVLVESRGAAVHTACTHERIASRLSANRANIAGAFCSAGAVGLARIPARGLPPAVFGRSTFLMPARTLLNPCLLPATRVYFPHPVFTSRSPVLTFRNPVFSLSGVERQNRGRSGVLVPGSSALVAEGGRSP